MIVTATHGLATIGPSGFKIDTLTSYEIATGRNKDPSLPVSSTGTEPGHVTNHTTSSPLSPYALSG